MVPSSFPEVALFPEDSYALAQPRGTISGELILAYGREMAYHPEWRVGFTEVWDATLFQDIDIVPTDIGRLNALEKETLHLLRESRTIIIHHRPLIRTTVDLYARLVKRIGREIVTAATQDEAADLLGIESLPLLT